ncbi:MAG: hypothetical protein COT15_01500 [Candidatus Diapherotrites archaeon CG08_land_8_20_14_0_20_34_12]|nr:MAG: hypothetical protein COT15_01500 [Candidatus Diapherotrites archaeon CG08_land_8_20_14_0_20_34_12]
MPWPKRSVAHRKKAAQAREQKLVKGWVIQPGMDTTRIDIFHRGNPQRRKYFLAKQFEGQNPDWHRSLLGKLRDLGIPTGKADHLSDDFLFVRDLSKDNVYMSVDLFKDPSMIDSFQNARSIAAGLARDLAILHNNELWIDTGRKVLEPWLIYFKGKKQNQQERASRAIVDVGAIRGLIPEEGRIRHMEMQQNIYGLADALPIKYASLIYAIYRKYCQHADSVLYE